MPSDWAGKTVLVTGASRGIGKACAVLFAEQGANLILASRSKSDLEVTATSIAKEDQKILVVPTDVTEPSQVKHLFQKINEEFGGLDVLVNNAGVGITGPVEVQDMEATKLAFDTNVLGYHRLVRAVLPGMRARKQGHIFAVSSQLGRVMVPYSGHYSATKFAVEAMFEQLAYELVPHNIGVTIIEPGGYPTKVWVNRNRYSQDLKNRASQIHLDGYPQIVATMGTEDGSGRQANPMDVPRAMARVLAMAPGTRPVRLPVSAGSIPQVAINEVCAETQVGWLGESGYGPLIKAVHNV